MFICRLFHRDHPFEQLEARLLADGRITLGRDTAADWPLEAADAAVSRVHCTLFVEEGRLYVCDSSTNGTYFADGRRLAPGEPVVLAPQQSIHMGSLSLFIELANGQVATGAAFTTVQAPLSTNPVTIPDDWAESARPQMSQPNASLLEAFCEGARLDASVLSSEDPVDLMRRVGAVYQQAVLGLSALMADRARMKATYQVEGTTISAMDNNPFKWTHSRQLAQELLCGKSAGFLSAADAVHASFEDLSQHLTAMGEAANAAAELTMQTLAPEAIEAEAKGQASLLRGRAAACWDVLNRRYAALASHDPPEEGALQRAFSEAYGRALQSARK